MELAGINLLPIVAAVILISLKQFCKLYIHHKPDKIDYLKSLVSLPMDISFLVVSLFIKTAMYPKLGSTVIITLLVAYLFLSLVSTLLWRISESAIKTNHLKHITWSLPLNLALTGTAFYLALNYVGL